MAGERLRCYLASPLGFNEAGRHYYEEVFLPTLAEVIEPVDPWAIVTDEEIHRARAGGRLRELMLEVGRRNTGAIRSCELLVALLDGQELDAGTVAELGYAAALGKRCFGLRSDIRRIGDETMALNLQVESFILESGGLVAPDLPALVDALSACAGQI